MNQIKNIIKYSLLVAVSGLVLFSCGKEDTLEPSNKDKNWHILEDSDDPVDKLRYDIYTEYGVPLYFNDTIGSRNDGIDGNGDPIIHYEVLSPNFNLGDNDEVLTFEKLMVEDNIKIAALQYVRDYILAKLDSKIYPSSFLLVGALDYDDGDAHLVEYGYRGMMVTLIAEMDKILDFTEEEKKHNSISIIAEEWTNYLVVRHNFLLSDFYVISDEHVYEDGSAYVEEVGTGYGDIPFMEPEGYGFLGQNHMYKNTETNYYLPDRRMDVHDYVYAYFALTKTEFNDTYKDYPFVMTKYDIISEIIEGLR